MTLWRKYSYTPQVRRGSMEYTYRPLVRVDLSGKNKTASFMALVDSGTDATMMDLEIAQMLEIDLGKSRKVTASGLGSSKPGFLAKLNIQVDPFDEIMTFTVIFVEGLGFDAILGQDNFFRHFHVRFEREVKMFYLRQTP